MRLAASDHRLANWEELLDELTPRQVTTLQAFQRIERWGEEREDLRAAVGIATIASAVSMSGKPVDPQKIFEVLQPERTKPDDGCVSPNQVAAMMARAKPKAR
jgi:hypothetical protein